MNTSDNQKLNSIYTLLKIVFGIVPIVAGLDKFTDLLTNWDMYLSPVMIRLLPFSPHTFMMVVGVIEIAAGIIVLAKPRIGSLIVTVWLVCIALNLLISGHFLDVAVRDLVMAIGAFTLSRVADLVEEPEEAHAKNLAGMKA